MRRSAGLTHDTLLVFLLSDHIGMICLPVMTRGALGVRSPMDRRCADAREFRAHPPEHRLCSGAEPLADESLAAIQLHRVRD